VDNIAEDLGVGGRLALFIPGVNMCDTGAFILGAEDFFGDFIRLKRYVRILLFADETAQRSHTNNKFIGFYHNALQSYKLFLLYPNHGI